MKQGARADCSLRSRMLQHVLQLSDEGGEIVGSGRGPRRWRGSTPNNLAGAAAGTPGGTNA